MASLKNETGGGDKKKKNTFLCAFGHFQGKKIPTLVKTCVKIIRKIGQFFFFQISTLKAIFFAKMTLEMKNLTIFTPFQHKKLYCVGLVMYI